MAAALLGNNAEEMQRVGVIRLRRKDLPVESLGFREAPGLVALKREIEGLWNRHSLNQADIAYMSSQLSTSCLVTAETAPFDRTFSSPIRQSPSALLTIESVARSGFSTR